jgi:hypothetical protein
VNVENASRRTGSEVVVNHHDLSAYADAESKNGKELEPMEEEFSYDLSEGLNLLRCCKQIHHEAAGVLYEPNIFAFTRTTSRHDITLYAGGIEDEPEEVYDHHAYNQISYAAHWLNSMGTHYPFLRKVIIDLDAMCPSECGDSSWSREVLPLVRVMWDHPEAQTKFGQPALFKILSGEYATNDRTISLNFEVVGTKTLTDVRIHIHGLMRLLCNSSVMDPKKPANLRFVLKNGTLKSKSKEVITMPIATLKQSVFL